MQQTAYENALLDSAYRYEQLKPMLFSLKISYEFRGKEVEDLRDQLRKSEMQGELQRQRFERDLAELRRQSKKKWWKGFKAGAGAGLIFGAVAGSKLN